MALFTLRTCYNRSLDINIYIYKNELRRISPIVFAKHRRTFAESLERYFAQAKVQPDEISRPREKLDEI